MEHTLVGAGSNLDWACSILKRCLEVSQDIDRHKLYQALNILEEIQDQMKGKASLNPFIPQSSFLSFLEDASTTSSTLQSYIQEIINDLRAIIQQMAVMDFNDWLVNRSQCRMYLERN